MSTFYESPNDYRNYLCHYGVKGMRWRNHKSKSLRDNRLAQMDIRGRLDGVRDEERRQHLRSRQENDPNHHDQPVHARPENEQRRNRDRAERFEMERTHRREAKEYASRTTPPENLGHFYKRKKQALGPPTLRDNRGYTPNHAQADEDIANILSGKNSRKRRR